MAPLSLTKYHIAGVANELTTMATLMCSGDPPSRLVILSVRSLFKVCVLYTHACTHIHTYIHTHACTHVHTYTCTHTHTHTRTHTHTHTYTNTQFEHVEYVVTLSHQNLCSTIFKTSTTDSQSSFTLSTDHLEATFHGSTGLLQSIKKQDTPDRTVRTNIDFIMYSSSSSGAYLFLPDGGVQVISMYSFS